MKLQNKLTVFALLCSILPLAGVATLAYNAARSSLSETVEDDLLASAERELQVAQNLIDQNAQNVATWAHLGIMQDVMSDDESGDLQTGLMKIAMHYPDFGDMLVLNDAGGVVAATDSKAFNDDWTRSPVFDALQRGEHIELPLAWSTRLRKKVATIAYPIRAEYDESQVVGMFVATIDWTRFQKVLAGHSVFGGEQSHQRQLIMRSSINGQVLYRTRDEHMTNALVGAISLDANVSEMDLNGESFVVATVTSSSMFDKESKGQTAGASGKQSHQGHSTGGGDTEMASDVSDADIRYSDAMGHYQTHAKAEQSGHSAMNMDGHRVNPHWSMSVVLDTKAAYASVLSIRDYLFSVGLLAALIMGALAFWLARAIVKPIKALAVGACDLASGGSSAELPIERSDEIGTLARSFAEMRTAVLDNEDELIKRNQVSEEAARLKGEFVANMSHEIRTPINGVLGMTELLLNTELNIKQERYAATIMRSSQSLLGVINDVLDFSKIEAGKLELQDSAFDVREMVEDVVEMLAENAHKKGLELIAQLSPDSHLAYQGDPTRLRQVLVNLMGNAIKFTSEGEVRLQVSSVLGEGDDETLKFEVVDTGIGIPKEAQAAIFESFVQADGSTTRRFGGTGLGLAISARLVELMGGKIDVQSVPDEGSTFSFTAKLKRLSDSVEEAWGSKDSLVGKRVLIVDDNTTNREILEAHVKFWGSEHVSAVDAFDALRILRSSCEANQKFDLAILDMHMPGMDGLELASIIKDDPAIASVRLCMLSSVCDQLDTDAYQALGIQSTLTKPVRQTELYNCLTALMTRESTGAVTEIVRPEQTLDAQLTGRVLLAEDHPVNQEMMCEMLRIMGLSVVAVDNGEQAVEVLDREEFDIVLMDCQMPMMDGFEATAEIRRRQSALEVPMRTPIVALTANALKGDRDRCLASGMDDYLTKPVDTRALVAALKQWMPQDAEGENETLDESVEQTAVASVKTLSEHADISMEESVGGVEDIGKRLPVVQDGVSANEADPSEVPEGAKGPVSAHESLDQGVLAGVLQMCTQATPGFFAKIVQKYIDNSIDDVQSLQAALEDRDTATLGSRAHRLKSSSANLGGMQLAEICQQLEVAAKSEHEDQLATLVTRIIKEHQQVLEALVFERERAA